MTARRHFANAPPRRTLQGLDYQGRHPQAADPAEDDLNCAIGIFGWAIAALVLWLIVALALCAAMCQ